MVEINHEITAKWGSEPAPFEVEIIIEGEGEDPFLPPLVPTVTFSTDGGLMYQNYQIWRLEVHAAFR